MYIMIFLFTNQNDEKRSIKKKIDDLTGSVYYKNMKDTDVLGYVFIFFETDLEEIVSNLSTSSND